MKFRTHKKAQNKRMPMKTLRTCDKNDNRTNSWKLLDYKPQEIDNGNDLQGQRLSSAAIMPM
jgi:hypothetical protein